jgi:hypothetical protein
MTLSSQRRTTENITSAEFRANPYPFYAPETLRWRSGLVLRGCPALIKPAVEELLRYDGRSRPPPSATRARMSESAPSPL